MRYGTKEEVKRFLDLFRQLNKEQQIGRIRDTSKPVHSGNVEYYNNEISEDKKALQKIADKLNEEEERE